MKTIAAIILIFCIAGCGAGPVENPAANAPTYTEAEFLKDWNEVNTGEKAKAAGAEITIEPSGDTSSVRDITFKVSLKKRIKTLAEEQLLRQAIEIEIQRIDQFLLKYQRTFRIRSADGDLKIRELTPEATSTLTRIREAWARALKELTS